MPISARRFASSHAQHRPIDVLLEVDDARLTRDFIADIFFPPCRATRRDAPAGVVGALIYSGLRAAHM